MRSAVSILYLLAYFITLVLVILVVATVERRWGLHTWQSQGDIDAAVAMLIIGAVIFAPITLLLTKLSDVRMAGWNDHFRQSAGVYAIILLTVPYIITRVDQRYSLGYGVAAFACGLGLYAVAVNRLVLWFRGRRHGKGHLTPAISNSKPSLRP